MRHLGQSLKRVQKGLVLQTAVVAAIMGAKKQANLYPDVPSASTDIHKNRFEELPNLTGFKLFVTAKLNSQTGVEMEALIGVNIGLIIIYDILKAIEVYGY